MTILLPKDHPASRSGSLHKAQQTLQQLLAHWQQLPAKQQQFFKQELHALGSLQTKVQQQTASIAVFGLVNRGKSAVLNALLQKNVLEVGPLNGVTRSSHTVNWDPRSIFKLKLIDTPGLNEVDGAAREQLAWSVAQSADLILFVIAGDITQVEYQALLELQTLQKPILLVFNKIDLYPDQDRQAIYAQITSPRLRQLVSPREIVMVAAAPMPVKVRIHWPDNGISYEWEQPQPLIEPLRKKILQVLAQEGGSLIALNTLSRANALQQRILQKQLNLQSSKAEALSWKIISGKSLIVSLSPFPLVDLGIGILSDLSLIWTQAKLYHLPLSRWGIVKLLQRVGISCGVLLLAELGTALPFAGYGASIVWQGVIVVVTSRWLNQAVQGSFKDDHFWGDLSPKLTAQQILEQLEKGSILSRLKREVSRKLGLRSDKLSSKLTLNSPRKSNV